MQCWSLSWGLRHRCRVRPEGPRAVAPALAQRDAHGKKRSKTGRGEKKGEATNNVLQEQRPWECTQRRCSCTDVAETGAVHWHPGIPCMAKGQLSTSSPQASSAWWAGAACTARTEHVHAKKCKPYGDLETTTKICSGYRHHKTNFCTCKAKTKNQAQGARKLKMRCWQRESGRASFQLLRTRRAFNVNTAILCTGGGERKENPRTEGDGSAPMCALRLTAQCAISYTADHLQPHQFQGSFQSYPKTLCKNIHMPSSASSKRLSTGLPYSREQVPDTVPTKPFTIQSH